MQTSSSRRAGKSGDQPFVDWAPVSQFGRYELVAKLGEGRRAVTWRARLLDFGHQGPTGFFARQLVKGQSLEAVLRRAEHKGWPFLPTAVALHLAIKICDGLQHAHGRAELHGELCPANVLIGYYGELKLADFALAHAAELDSRSDLAATGAMLYRMLGGGSPLRMKLPPALDAVLLEAISGGRLATADELGAALKQALAAAEPAITECSMPVITECSMPAITPPAVGSLEPIAPSGLEPSTTARTSPSLAPIAAVPSITARTSPSLEPIDPVPSTTARTSPSLAPIGAVALDPTGGQISLAPSLVGAAAASGTARTAPSLEPLIIACTQAALRPVLTPVEAALEPASPPPGSPAAPPPITPLATALLVPLAGPSATRDDRAQPPGSSDTAIVLPPVRGQAPDPSAAPRLASSTAIVLPPVRSKARARLHPGKAVALGAALAILFLAGLLFVLDPSSGAGEGAELWITSNPAGAMVTLDGRPLPNRTPFSVKELPTGRPHMVIVELPGHNRWIQPLKLKPGAPNRLHAILQAAGP